MEYIKRKRKERLFKQWVDQAELPPEEIPPEVLGEHPGREDEFAGGDVSREGLPHYAAMTDIDRGLVRLPIRYVLIGLSLIALLLVIVSVLVTVLIMQPG